MFAGILPLPAGHVLVARDGRVKIDSWWDVPRDEVSSSSEAELADELRALLDDSVKRRLPEDSAVGVFLSGGVDSAAVTALSRRHTGTVKTFSLGFEEGGVYDELDDARRTAALLGTHHQELRVGHPELHERLDALNEHFDEPLGIASGFNMFVLGALAREEGVRVVMTGDGGDELFGGYRRHVADQFASAYQRLPRPLIEGAVPAALARLPRLGRTKQIASTLPIVDPVARSVAWLEVLTPELRAELLQPGAAAGAVHHPTQVFAERAAAWNGAGGSLSRQLYVELKEWLPGTVFDRTARATTAHRLETRMPLFDHRIVAFAFRTPDQLKIRALATQRLLRRALHDVVPAHTLRKRKRGFTTPVDPWFRGPLAPFVREILLDERTRWRGYFDSHVVERLWNEHASGRRIWDRALWLLMTFELWHRAHVDRVRS